MNLPDFLAIVQGRLIVSCQAGVGHPLRDSATVARLAQAGVAGGAAAIRGGGVGGIADVAAIRAAIDVPVIGLTKQGSSGVFITPTVRAALDVIAAGADVVAVDATGRPRPDGRVLGDTIAAVHEAGRLVMADIADLDTGLAAADAGADLIATTLAGYLGGAVSDARGGAVSNSRGSAVPDGPDLDLVAALRARLPGIAIIAEGRYHHPDQVTAALAAGANAVVVGTAITDPVWITRRFANAIEFNAIDGVPA